MQKDLESLGLAVKDARLNASMTQCELAERLNISRHHLMKIENAHNKPSYELLCGLVRELRLPTSSIFYSENIIAYGEVEEIVSTLRTCEISEVLIFSSYLNAMLDCKSQLLASC